MITRIWHGRTKREDSNVYRQYVLETGVPDTLKTDGNLGGQIWQREEGTVTHIWMVTQWENMDCVKRFAGNEVEKAKYYPKDERFLLELEPHVIHCRTFSFSRARITNYLCQLDQLFGGGSWNNESFMEKLKAVDERKAFTQPGPDRHCVAEIVWHCAYWTTVLIKRIQGDNRFCERTYDDQNFLSLQTLQQKGWDNVLSEFKRSHEQLIALLSGKNDDFLEEEYQEGKKYDIIVEGVIHHDIYHLGQIGFVIALVSQ
jgi:uncharacterized damage-inducible protein DinB